MTDEDKNKLLVLIPLWNKGSKAAAEEISRIVLPWVRKFASLAVLRQQEQFKVADGYSIPTPVSLWEVEDQTQEVMLAFSKSQHSVTKLTTPIALYKSLRLITHRILLNKIKEINQQCLHREKFNGDVEVSEIQESVMIILMEHIHKISVKHPDKAVCYAMHHIDGLKTDEISDITNIQLRDVQRYIKAVGVELYGHLKETSY